MAARLERDWSGLFARLADLLLPASLSPTSLLVATLLILGTAYGCYLWVRLIPADVRPSTLVIPSTSTYPSRRYTQSVKIPAGQFIQDFLKGRIELLRPTGFGLVRMDRCVDFRLGVWDALGMAWTILPTMTWHSLDDDRKKARLFFDRHQDFFAAFLGTDLLMSPAMFSAGHRPNLEEAQKHRLARISRDLLGIQERDRVLDLSLGWGTFALFIASSSGASVTGMTSSSHQAAHAMRIRDMASLKDSIKIHTLDYRELPPPTTPSRRSAIGFRRYTKAICIGTIDRVGWKNVPHFLGSLASVLAPDGLVYLSLTVTPCSFDSAGWQPTSESLFYHAFRLCHIQPGFDTPVTATLDAYIAELASAGFHVLTVENISEDSARTFAHWHGRWMDHKHALMSSDVPHDQWSHGGSPEAVSRQWELYFAWTASLLARGVIATYAVVARKRPSQGSVPSVAESLAAESDKDVAGAHSDGRSDDAQSSQ